MALLTDDEIEAALAALPGWSREGDRLVRELAAADDEDADALTARVMVVADRLNHHPVVQRTPAGLRLLLWSHDTGGITHRDVRLATALVDVLD